MALLSINLIDETIRHKLERNETMTFKKQMLGVVVSALLATTAGLGTHTYISKTSALEQTVNTFSSQELESRKILIESMAKAPQAALEASLKSGLTQEEALALYDKSFGSMRYSDGGYFFILDSKGMFVHHPLPEFVGKDMSEWKDSKGNFVTRLLNEAARSDGWTSYWWPKASGGKPYEKISFAAPISGTDWVIGTGLYTDDIDNKISEMRVAAEDELHSSIQAQSLFALLILASLTLGASTLINRTTSALNDVNKKVKELAQGEGDLTIRLSTDKGSDEIRELGSSFNNFMNYLSSIIEKISEASGNVSATSSELGQFIDNLNSEVSKQHAQSEMISAAITQMAASSEQVAGNTNSVASETNNAKTSSSKALEAVSLSEASIKSLSEGTRLSAKHIEELSEHSKQIHVMLDSINAIAEQTNLLALNAAIEAARAGEQGRGFAVVADEVRALAGRSSQTTDEIAKLLAILDSLVQNALSSMHSNEAKASDTVEASTIINSQLQEIVDRIQTVSQMSNEIATASTQQSQAVQEVNESVNTTHEAVERVKRISDDTTQLVSRLSTSGDELDNVVSGFKF